MACNSETPQYCAWSNTIKSRISSLDLRGVKSTNIRTKSRLRAVSLFLQSARARARERCAAKTRETRAAAREEKGWSLFCRASPVSRLQSRAWSFACLGRFARRTKTKERLLVVCIKNSWADARFYRSLPLKTIPSRKIRIKKMAFKNERKMSQLRLVRGLATQQFEHFFFEPGQRH